MKIAGYRVELSEIEFYAKNFIKNNKLVALSIEKEKGLNSIVLVIENLIKLEGIKEYLQNNLPSYMVPSEIINIKEFPYNNNGKIDRNKIKKMIIK